MSSFDLLSVTVDAWALTVVLDLIVRVDNHPEDRSDEALHHVWAALVVTEEGARLVEEAFSVDL